MKILWQSTSPWGPSSYSVLSKRTVPDIVRFGHEVSMNTWYGLQGEPQLWPIRERLNGKTIGTVTVMPCVNGNAYATDTMLPLYQKINADLLITCSDVWVMPPHLTGKCNFAPWFPIDCDPAPENVIKSIEPAIRRLVYSQWGVDVLAKSGIKADYVPCSADIQLFKPMPMIDARRKLHMPEDRFLVTMVSANKDPYDRKGFSEALQAFKIFKERHEDALMYVHTNWSGPINLFNMTKRLGIADTVMLPDQLEYMLGMINDEQMRMIYNASDVFLNTAKSEGFGLPLLEAQMCGCPIAATDFSTTRELMSAGWLIEGQLQWSLGNESWRKTVSIEKTVEALEEAYAERGNQNLRERARDGVLKYDTFAVANRYWKPILREIENAIKESRGSIAIQKPEPLPAPIPEPA